MAEDNDDVSIGTGDGVDVAALQSQIAELEAAKSKAENDAKRALGEAMERKRKLERFNDVDPDEYQRLKTDFGGLSGDEVEQFRQAMQVAKTEEERKLLTERGLEGYLEHHTSKRLSQTEKAHQDALEKLQADLEAERTARGDIVSRYQGMRLETAVLSTLTDKYEDSAKRDILRAARESAKFEEDDRIAWSVDGEEIFAEGGKPATAETWLARETERNPHWLKRSTSVRSPGSDGAGMPKDNPFKDRKARSAQLKLRSENPEIARRMAVDAGWSSDKITW